MNPTSEPTPSTSGTGRGFFRGLAAALAIVLALALAATVVSAQTDPGQGGGGDGTDEAPAVDGKAFGDYRDCLAENGIERPADGERPNRDEITDEQREAFRAAREACADVHPFAEQIAAARECLEENGVELPEDGERPNPDEITDEQREAFQAAREACADELPDGAGFRHGRGGPHGFGGPGPDGGGEAPAGFGGLPADGLTPA
jgi:hypothetical protein